MEAIDGPVAVPAEPGATWPAVMAPALAACDSDGVLAFLDSTNPRDVALDERLRSRSIGGPAMGPGVTVSSTRPEPAG